MFPYVSCGIGGKLFESEVLHFFPLLPITDYRVNNLKSIKYYYEVYRNVFARFNSFGIYIGFS